jgi:small conductance mechanosensitive channel
MDKNENKKSSITKWIVLGIMCAITIAAFVLSGYLYGAGSVFYNNISTNVFVNTVYQKIPAFIRTIQILTIAYLLNWGLKTILMKLLSKNNRAKTVTTLVTSFLKYFIAIVALLLILSAWGADTRSLIASAGILGLIIGLGAQSLIADILAGIFIVFEGEFQVGDIIVIDGWRGTVSEIGIRTTKVVDWGGNVRIINNSSISSVINQTKELSIAVAYISIEYGQPIPEVEIVIKNNL